MPSAVGKQMFLEFEGDVWLRVHLGMYGAWDFAGDILMDATIASANGRMGQTNQRGTFLDRPNPDAVVFDSAGENSLTSIGAPRRTRLRMSESEKEGNALDDVPARADRPGAGAPAHRHDRRRPARPDRVRGARPGAGRGRRRQARARPAASTTGPEAEERFVARVRKKPTPIALLLMDQAVVARHRQRLPRRAAVPGPLNPHTPGQGTCPKSTCAHLWRDWAKLLAIGVETGQMMTMDDLDPEAYRAAMANRDDRHWVYKREGLPCRVCGTNIALEELGGRKLYWCPYCQA